MYNRSMLLEQTLPQDTDSAFAPDFTVPDLDGNPISLSDFRGDKHIVLVFNRGFT